MLGMWGECELWVGRSNENGVLKVGDEHKQEGETAGIAWLSAKSRRCEGVKSKFWMVEG